MNTKFQVEMTACQLLQAAQALTQAAGEAYDDQRYVSAIAGYKQAASYYGLLGMNAWAVAIGNKARLIDSEIIAASEEEAV